MKQPKTFLLLSVIVAVLVLAVAYAAIGNVAFNVTGNATATGDAANFKVAFTSFEKSGEGTITGTASGQKATFDVSGLTTKGQKSYLTFNIENSSEDLYASLSYPSISNSNPTYFKVTATYGGQIVDNKRYEEPNQMAPRTTGYLYVTVELIKTPIDVVSTNIGITFSAAPVTDLTDLGDNSHYRS